METRIREIALAVLRELPKIDLKDGHIYEEEWCRQLAERFNAQFPVSATATRRKDNFYPASRLLIDLLIRFENDACLWLESKGAWKSCLGDTGELNRSFRKHLLRDDPSEHTALSDIRHKLPKIATIGDYVGELLIGFDSVLRPMDKDVEELIEIASLNRYPWEGYHLRWTNPNDHRYSFGCWLWIRPVALPI